MKYLTGCAELFRDGYIDVASSRWRSSGQTPVHAASRLSATSMTFALTDSGLSISPATCAAMNRRISASTPADDAQQLAAQRFRRDVDGDVGRPRLLDVEDQQQRFGGARGRAQRDLAEHHELGLVDPQVDDHVDLERDADRERDQLADRTGSPAAPES